MTMPANNCFIDEEKPTKDEVFRDFLNFRMNHREEKLFRHDHFTDIMAKEYAIPRCHLRNTNDLFNAMLEHPMSHFVDVLRQCDLYVSTKDARYDLSCVLSYAKEGL